MLEWSVEGGFGVELNGEPVEHSGQMEVCPEETTPYWLGVDTGETMEEREVVIVVEGPEEPPPEGEGVGFINLMVEPDGIPAGECAMLFWEVVPPGEWPVLLDGQEVPPVGEQEVCPGNTTTYELFVEAPGGPQERTVTLHVEGEPEPEPPPEGEGIEFINLVVEPDVIPAGACAMLFWEVVPPEGEWPVLLNGQEVPHVGEQEVCPGDTTTYELLVEALGGPQERTVTLHVEGEPEPGQPSEPPPASPATPAPPSASPARPAPTSPPSGGLSADVRPSDLYADKQPHGTVWVRITNDGPGTLTNKKVEINGWGTAYLRTTAGGASVSYPATDFTLNLAPGQTQTINLGWQIDTSLYKYDLNVIVKVKDFTDPNSSNNGYAESIVPTVPVATPTPSGAPPGGGSWGVLTTDLAVTDLFADKLVQGKVYARLTNHGPDSLSNVSVQLSCSQERTEYTSGTKVAAVSLNTLTLSLNPGQTKAFDTGLSVETTKYWYKITCSTQVSFKDPNTANDSYTETIPPPP
jgi:hypothetical protein